MGKTALIIYGGGSKCSVSLGILSAIHEVLHPHVDMVFASSAGAGTATAFITNQYEEGIFVAKHKLSFWKVLQKPKSGLINLDLFMKEWTTHALDQNILFGSHIEFKIGVFDVETSSTEYITPTRDTLITLLKASASIPRFTTKVFIERDGRRCRLVDGGFADLIGYLTIREKFPEVEKIIIVGYKEFGAPGLWIPNFIRKRAFPNLDPVHPSIQALIQSPQVLANTWERIEKDENCIYIGPSNLEEGPLPVRLIDGPKAIQKAIELGYARGQRALRHKELEMFLDL